MSTAPNPVIEDVLSIVRRTETRLCKLMQAMNVDPNSNNSARFEYDKARGTLTVPTSSASMSDIIAALKPHGEGPHYVVINGKTKLSVRILG